MKLTIGSAQELMPNMKAYFQGTSSKQNYTHEEPLREELFSSDKMNQFGKALAKKHQLSKKPAKGTLLKRLDDNEKVLNAVRKLLVEAITKGRIISPAGEWIVDNFYLVEEQIHTAKKHLPEGYSETLPQLFDVELPGLTRVYDIALQIISHSDGRIDLDRLGSFIDAYQSVVPLQIGELWAIPIMLRLTLLENLRRVSSLIAIDMIDKNLADYWAQKMLDVFEHDPKNVILITGDMVRSNPPMVSAFVSEMNRQLLGKGPGLALSLNWLEQRLSEEGLSSNELVNAEIQKQAVNQVSISNSIGSLRLLSALDWRDFVEKHSIVEQTLRKDKFGIYGKMDFQTRDIYRHAVENIAKRSKLSENDVAKLVIQLAYENPDMDQGVYRKSHVGYYLIDKGVKKTEEKAGVKYSLADNIGRLLTNNRLLSYLGSAFIITLLISAFFLAKAYGDTTNIWLLSFIAIVLLLSASQLALTLVNSISMILVKPKLLPRMDFSASIPDEYRTLVVIPAMLMNAQSIEVLVEALEVRFLANRDKNLFFALLTDFTDANKETMPTDNELLELVKQRIEELKEKYEDETRDIFFLFHRPRKWNSQEGVWMSYERKRGKLSALNSLLRGDSTENFSCIVGNYKALSKVKYVITLDSDTQLPRGAAWKMVASMSHPLNQPLYDSKLRRIIEGYGILQPRVTVSLPEANSSFYNRLHGNEPGIDPYTQATSDVYQDLFDEGSFIGKGIYDVDVFEEVLKGRFPENRILSHDLLEGCYVRSGLLSDVELYEKYPMTYRLDMKRRFRWTRGDWQILPWFLPYIPGPDQKRQKNPLSALSRWKIFDNLRRSLVPISLTALIIVGWALLKITLFWTLAVTGIIVFPIFIVIVIEAFNKPGDVILSHHIYILVRNIGSVAVRTLFSVICLPYEAYANLMAISRTTWRVFVSHKKLLQWTPSSNIEWHQHGLVESYMFMWAAPFLAIAVTIFLIVVDPVNLIIAAPVLFFWLLSPFLTWFTSLRPEKQKALLTDTQRIFLLKVARKTWSFFEALAGPEDNWLPPDNFQQHPMAVIAHRTSPTNIGISLLANLAARDFGYISTGHCLERIGHTIGTLQKLERYQGHFYNWYDTETLEPLRPKYISTVDSGNLAGHLLTLRQGLFEILHQSIVGPKMFEGLLDTFRVFKNFLSKEDADTLLEFPAFIENRCMPMPTNLDDIYESLMHLSVSYDTTVKKLKTEAGTDVDWWKVSLLKQIEQALDDIRILEPWFQLPLESRKFAEFIDIDSDITLKTLHAKATALVSELDVYKTEENTAEENAWLDKFIEGVTITQQHTAERIALIEKLGYECIGLADMEWAFLYSKSRHLLSIGYKVDEHLCDPGYYDLLASEARLCTFVAIAQGKLPEESWFALGRLLTKAGGDPILLSWGGSMFEYLMPLLVMPTYENTLLDQTYKATISRQIEYGKQRAVPWGISESGYNMVDGRSNYQYRSFGVPGLGLKRGLEADLVIAPYATVLSLMVAPELSCQNLETLFNDGFEGAYGFYEAVDYTPSRLQRGQTNAIIQSFMAHHQGMSLLAMSHLFHDQPMQRRFEAEPQFQATLLLLQERIPKASSFYKHTTAIAELDYQTSGTEVRTVSTPNTPIPELQLLSNGKYHVMITNSGGGYSRWKDLAVTRWHEDSTCDNWGTFCYICDLESGEYWSNTHQPTLKRGKVYEAAFTQGRVDFHTINNNIETRTGIVVSPEDDIEMRRMQVANKSGLRRTIEITSYAEVVLAPPASDAMQPAFSDLFVQTEILPPQHSIICTRRPRSADEKTPYMFHAMIVHGKENVETSYETDRMAFLGHGNTVANPRAMDIPGPLSSGQGSVLDPIVAIRYRIVLDADEIVTIDLITGIGDTREICDNLIEKYQDKHHKDRVFELAWTHSQVILRQMNATEADEQMFGRLAGSVIFMNRSLRADPSIIIKNNRGQSGLWGYSISGDLPIILLQIRDQSNLVLAKQLIQAHTYWRLKGLIVDLVIWNEDHGGYRQIFQNQIQALIPNELMDRPGGVFVRAADQISNEDRILFQTVARVNISDADGTLADHINRRAYSNSKIPYITQILPDTSKTEPVLLQNDLKFYNGRGGFSSDGSEYIIGVDDKNRTPVPWVNVIANPSFGTVISESGQAYTWVENAHEMRLTPWNNDPVTDSAGEIFYLRDEDAGNFWSTTPLPRGGSMPFITKHGFGYSIFEHAEEDIFSAMSVFVDIKASVKFMVLKVRNDSERRRHLSATGYIELVLGDLRAKTAMQVITEIDPNTGAFFAKNPYNTGFDGRVVFFDTDDAAKTFTGDRTEFIGRNNSLQSPDAMYRTKLSGKVGVAYDPCAAIRVSFNLEPGDEREIIFRLGAGKDYNNASDIVNKFRGTDAAHEALDKVKHYWKHAVSALQVETPDVALNLISNGWLTYQTLSCRLWGRSGFYQSGGAFGFRDQLQDVLSLFHAKPLLARKQILLCATRQFEEGDVQHWWHPPTGRGVRTLVSDDYLWLPYVTCRYVVYSGDTAILDESLHYLKGRPLLPGEDSYYELPEQSVQAASLYDHCMRAIKHGFRYGEHGLPLMGEGDWNDGMNRVGSQGKGESVWLGFFLFDILTKFIDIASMHNDPDFAEQCQNEAQTLRENIEKNGWDGKWYRRAYFDDGTPLGSSTNTDCQIDSLSQSWSVISGAGKGKHPVTAMESAGNFLINKEAKLIKLLEPPFDKGKEDPGYIKGYVPGVRENGGQYTHAAVWLIIAFAKLGDTQRTWELLQMLNPINHSSTPESIEKYKVEPYVEAADVYAQAPHTGRGGWTWYTGSAGWMYQLITEWFLGLQQHANNLSFAPCIPSEWDSFKVRYRYKNTFFDIVVMQKQGKGKTVVILDGEKQENQTITLTDDGEEHNVLVTIFTNVEA